MNYSRYVIVTTAAFIVFSCVGIALNWGAWLLGVCAGFCGMAALAIYSEWKEMRGKG